MVLPLFVIYILLILLLLFAFTFFATPFFSRIPYVATRKKILNEIIDALELKDDSIFYDLGCGDGRIFFTALKRNPNISCVGIEIAPFPYLLAYLKKFFSKSKNVDIRYGNFFKIDISPATHLFLYLFPNILDELLPKFEKELKKGTRIVSCDFKFSKRLPNKVLDLKSVKGQINRKIYIYEF